LTVPPRTIVALLFALMTLCAAAQQSAPPQPRISVLLDPAHGGSDSGAHLTSDTLEKDFTLAFAARLRPILTAAGFTVLATRDSDPTVPFSTDQRAEIANQRHPSLCLILHATASGSGIHIVSSALTPPAGSISPHAVVPWNTAQAASVPQSLDLANDLGLALLHVKLPVTLSRASIRPLDNLTCPAAAIEIAPLSSLNGDPTPVTNPAYQQRILQAISAALSSWRSQVAAAAEAGDVR
jgi:N-acetylmuramoyl-L-alanine amidase